MSNPYGRRVSRFSAFILLICVILLCSLTLFNGTAKEKVAFSTKKTASSLGNKPLPQARPAENITGPHVKLLIRHELAPSYTSANRSEVKNAPKPLKLSDPLQHAAPAIHQPSLRHIYNQLRSGEKIARQGSHYRVPKQKTVYLTFDDGPSQNTPEVLSILKKYHIKATFFEIGVLAKRYPDIVRQVVKAGNTLGNHSYNHEYHQLYGHSFQNFWDQIQKTNNLFYRIAGVRPKWIRAPGGTFENFSPFYFYYLSQAGYRVEDWNIDCGDASRPGVTAAEMVAVVKKSPLYHNLVFLMHDGPGHGETVKALPAIIQYLKSQGYRFAPLSNQVKPYSYPVSKLTSRWRRHTSFSQFQTIMKEVNAEQAVRLKRETLTVRLGSRNVPFKQGTYDFRYNRFEVSARKLIKNMGGSIHWYGKERMAVARYHSYTIQYRLRQMQIRIYLDGRLQRTMSLADMRLEHGTLFVPVRQTIEMLGGRVAGYSVTPGDYKVLLKTRSKQLFTFMSFINNLTRYV